MIEIIPNWHPLFVHFPITFGTAALVLAVTGRLFDSKPWAKQCLVFGRWMVWATAVFACITAVFGWFAFNSVEHDESSHAAMLLHRNWALLTLMAWLLLAGWEVWRKHSEQLPSPGLLIALVLAWLMLASTAWHGGELVYRHGLGVLSLPDVESEVEPHQHEGVEHGHEH